MNPFTDQLIQPRVVTADDNEMEAGGIEPPIRDTGHGVKSYCGQIVTTFFIHFDQGSSLRDERQWLGAERIGKAQRDAQNPAWSPDGTQILYYETDSTGNDEIYLMNSDGTERHRLIKGAWPSWYPDASKILARLS